MIAKRVGNYVQMEPQSTKTYPKILRNEITIIEPIGSYKIMNIETPTKTTNSVINKIKTGRNNVLFIIFPYAIVSEFTEYFIKNFNLCPSHTDCRYPN